LRVAELEQPSNRDGRRGASSGEEAARLGLAVRPLTEEEKRRGETDGEIVVTDVQGAAQQAGIQPGDVILAINQHEVNSVSDLRTESRKLRKGDSAALLVERGDARIYVPVKVAG